MLQTTETINHFSGHDAFLHNDYPCEINVDRKQYHSVTHAYIVLSLHDRGLRNRLRHTLDLEKVKRDASGKKRLEHWSFTRDNYMSILLAKKFLVAEHRQALLDTGNATLVFGNSKGDRYWGVDQGIGRNRLGELLMEIRDRLRNE